jgi:uncharacterized repeat protein (TIGR01451 family)
LKKNLAAIIVVILLSCTGLILLVNPQLVPRWPRLSLPESAGLKQSIHAGDRMTVPATELALIGPAAPLEPADVIPFVQELHFHGIPYDRARQFGPEAVPILVDLLADPAHELYATNIVVTLGFIGHPTARPPLLDYLTQTRGEVSLNQYRALLSVPYGLAQLAHHGDVAALAFLLDASDPGYWTSQRLPWTFEGQTHETGLYQQTLLALGVSGLPQAQARLVEIAGQGGLSTQEADETLRQALELNQRVQQEGMAPVVSPDPNNSPDSPESQETISDQAVDTNSSGHLQTFIVGRHSSMSRPTTAEADTILTKASEVMQTADSSADIACCVAMQLNGSVGIFSATDGIVDTSGELYTLFNLSAYQIKLVPALNYCGGFNTSIIGCARINSSKNMILEHLDNVTLDGIVWAHEFGHNQGLMHPSTYIPTRIMNGSLNFSNPGREMTQTECNAWHSTIFNPGTSFVCPFSFDVNKTLSATSVVTANATITYLIEVKNNTSQTVTGITVSDDLPPELTYVNGSATATPNIGDLSGFPTTTPPFSLNPQASVLITFQALVDGAVTKGDLVINKAIVNSPDLSLSAPIEASHTAIVDPEESFLPLIFKSN